MKEQKKNGNIEDIIEETTEANEIIDISDVDEKRDRCKKIVHSAAVACGGVSTSIAQLPLADSAIITPIQIAMVVAIGKEFGKSLTDTAARAVISSFSAALLGRSVSAVLFGWVPIIGNIVNTATSAGLTEAIGQYTINKFVAEAA